MILPTPLRAVRPMSSSASVVLFLLSRIKFSSWLKVFGSKVTYPLSSLPVMNESYSLIVNFFLLRILALSDKVAIGAYIIESGLVDSVGSLFLEVLVRISKQLLVVEWFRYDELCLIRSLFLIVA